MNSCGIRAQKSLGNERTRLHYTDTPLNAASRNGHSHVVKWLLSSEVVDPTLESCLCETTHDNEQVKHVTQVHTASIACMKMLAILRGAVSGVVGFRDKGKEGSFGGSGGNGRKRLKMRKILEQQP